MGLNPRGRGRGRGSKGNFPNKGQRGGRMGGQGPMFRGGPPGMFCPPPMGFPPEPPFGGGPFFPGPSAFGFGPPRPGFGKFPRKNFKRRVQQKSNDAPAPEIDLTKPWVTEEIKLEDGKKQECLETWRKSKNDEDWSKYKSQKEIVKNLYDKAREEYLARHQEEANYWENVMRNESMFGGRHYCETCEKGFKSEDDLIWHQGEHETCGRDGCQFTAHPKVVAKHIKMQHDSGLFRRIGKVYTEEEIAKWIDERKRKYPSRKVIEEKKALEEEKQKRGEKIQEDKSKFNKSFQNRNKKERKAVREEKVRKPRRMKKRKRNKIVERAIEEEIIANKRTVPAFSGIGSDETEAEKTSSEQNIKNNDIAISDDEWEYQKSKQALCQPLSINQSLELLASAYNSDDDKVDERHMEEPENDVEDGDEGRPDEVQTVCIKSNAVNSSMENHLPKNKERKMIGKRRYLLKNKRNFDDSRKNSFENRNLTLLEKLLSKEIRHERNVILQCVHYVVKNNFFHVT